MKTKNETELIIKRTEDGEEWVVDVCSYLDNSDALEYFLTKINAQFSSNEDGLFANRKDVIKADHLAWKEQKQMDKENLELLDAEIETEKVER